MAQTLIIDGDSGRIEWLRRFLKVEQPGWPDPSRATSASEGKKPLQENPPDILFLGELCSPDEIKELIEAARKMPSRPFVILLLREQSTGGNEFVLSELKGKPDAVLYSPFSMATFSGVMEKYGTRMSAPSAVSIHVGSQRLIGPGQRMQEVFQNLLTAAATVEPVLLEGEPGVGKRLAAEAIHQHSQRKAQPFGEVRCTGRDAADVEAELFGCEKGAWEWVGEIQDGRLRELDGGTLYLEGIDALSAQAQAKLLGFLDDRTFSRVKGTKRWRSEVRLIASAAKPLILGVEHERFAPHLYHRFAANRIVVPSLRSRPLDIPTLVHNFLAPLRIKIAGEAMDILMNCSWPGNIDELRSVLTSAASLCDRQRITVTDLPSQIVAELGPPPYRYVFMPEGPAEGF